MPMSSRICVSQRMPMRFSLHEAKRKAIGEAPLAPFPPPSPNCSRSSSLTTKCFRFPERRPNISHGSPVDLPRVLFSRDRVYTLHLVVVNQNFTKSRIAPIKHDLNE